MEIFFGVIIVFSLCINVAMNVVLFYKLQLFEFTVENLQQEVPQILHTLMENFEEVDQKVVTLSNQIDRSLQEIKESLVQTEPMKPMKSNNWESIRDVFKGPVRVEINERN